MALAAGTRLGRYEILSLLGEGGMGEVYLARDSQLERTVALKILRANVAADSQRMRRFVQEAKTTSALNHPNILTVHEVGQTESLFFIATEFIDGATLRAELPKGPMRLSAALDVATQVAAALTAAHSAGIVHRDIKPENIMLRRDGYVKVLDFGIAKLTEKSIPEQAESQAAEPQSTGQAAPAAAGQPAGRDDAPTVFLGNTESGMLLGTALYMSPEQARGLAVDARTDIFSFGVVLYEMVAGHVPFKGRGTREVIASILKSEPRPLSRYRPDAPDELQRIVSRALAKGRAALPDNRRNGTRPARPPARAGTEKNPSRLRAFGRGFRRLLVRRRAPVGSARKPVSRRRDNLVRLSVQPADAPHAAHRA